MKRVTLKLKKLDKTSPYSSSGGASTTYGYIEGTEYFENVKDICYDSDWLTIQIDDGTMFAYPIGIVLEVKQYS